MTARRVLPAWSIVEADRGVEVDLRALDVRFQRTVAAAARKASAARAPRVATITVELPARTPIQLLAAAHEKGIGATLWARPDESLGLVGLGEAWSIGDDGLKIKDAGSAWSALVRDAVCESLDEPAGGGAGVADASSPLRHWGAGAVAMGGFAFDQRAPVTAAWSRFGRASLILPQVAILSTARGSAATLAAVAVPGHDTVDAIQSTLAAFRIVLGTPAAAPTAPAAPPPAPQSVERNLLDVEELRPASEWRSVVAEAATAVRRGALRKVVVARGVRVRISHVDPAGVLARLQAEYPSCALFAISRRDRTGEARWFVGATPERLVRVRAGWVTAMALAGSAPRGTDEGEDRRLGETLLASAKDRTEHSVVVDVMLTALRAACDEVEIGHGPELLKLSNVQHLHTPMTARLRRGTNALDLVDRLHPTPAVGGVPRDEAIRWLRDHEGLDRGWYAGPIGWVDRAGEGEFSVAIRSALLGGGEALLYTGCGIVADSVPAFEYAESRLKLRPMLSALGAGGTATRGDPAS
jgi:isochorismate synthase